MLGIFSIYHVSNFNLTGNNATNRNQHMGGNNAVRCHFVMSCFVTAMVRPLSEPRMTIKEGEQYTCHCHTNIQNDTWEPYSFYE